MLNWITSTARAALKWWWEAEDCKKNYASLVNCCADVVEQHIPIQDIGHVYYQHANDKDKLASRLVELLLKTKDGSVEDDTRYLAVGLKLLNADKIVSEMPPNAVDMDRLS